ncbi:2825_t:CDS:2 [Entrophospora sp. SA101]|nr:2825_t:CDS:2 [Entrophospora sp. SA101]
MKNINSLYEIIKQKSQDLTGGGFQKERSQGNKEIKSYAESYTGKEEEKAAIEKYEQEKLEMKASPYNFYGRPERFKAPFLSPAEQLVQSLRENLIEKLVIISAYNVGKPGMIAAIGKITKQKKTFGKFANVELELTPMEKKGKVDGKMVSTNLR